MSTDPDRPASSVIHAKTEEIPPQRDSGSNPSTEPGPGGALLVRLVESWERGEPIPVLRLLEENDWVDEATAVELIYEEMHLKREAGIELPTAEVFRQYPRYAVPLRDVLEFDRLLDPSGGRERFPKPGERLGPFELVSVLGEGASGRTYVALESSLADRSVVLKVMPVEHVEHLNLARLQHTNIMPLYSEMVLAEKGLRILVMPYLGGIGLDRIFSRLSGTEPARRNGRAILEAIDGTSTDDWTRSPGNGTSRVYFERASYPEAIAHIGLCLAEAAAEAHARGLVHMDIKPSNVLISADARPVLLDFHLARAPVRQGDRSVDRLGGTPGWTSPEQDACFQAAAAGLPMPCDIDGRSDVHAIGAIMARALRLDEPAKSNRPVFGPEVSTGLGDIVRKCLAGDPANRYPSAAELAEDLRRHLAHEPLKGVANRSLVERLTKWRARNPTGIVWILAAGILVTATGLGLRQIDQARSKMEDEIRSAIQDSVRLETAGLYADAGERLDRVWAEASRYPGLRAGIDAIRQAKRQLQEAASLAELNETMETVRLTFRVRGMAESKRQKLADQCRKLWKTREVIMQASMNASQRDLTVRERVMQQLVEIAVVLTELTLQEGQADDRREAESILAEAESVFGPRFALALARASVESRSPRPTDIALPPAIEPASAWDFDQLGRFHMRHGRVAEAADAFEKAVALEPGQYWYHFDLAIARYERSEWQKALVEWSAAVALRPESAICRYDRGLTYEAMGRTDDALNDYLAALQRDKSLAYAAIRAAILKQRRGEEAEALHLLEHVARTSDDSRTRAQAWARIVTTHAQAGRTGLAREALREAASLGLVVDDPALIQPAP